MVRKIEYEKRHQTGLNLAEASRQPSEGKKYKTFGSQKGVGPTPYDMKHEGVTGSPSNASSEEESSSSEESSFSKDTTPPTLVLVVPGKKEGIAILGGITKLPVKMPNVPNPYLKKRVGIVKFVVPKSTVSPRKPTQEQRIVGTTSQKKHPTASRGAG